MINWNTELAHLQPVNNQLLFFKLKNLFTLRHTSTQNINDFMLYHSLRYYLRELDIESNIYTKSFYVGAGYPGVSFHYIHILKNEDAMLLNKLIIEKRLLNDKLMGFNNGN